MSYFNPSAQVIISIIPIVGIFFASVLIFFALLWRHHEIKMQIKNSTYNPARFNLKIFSLLTGLCLSGVGFILTVFFAFMAGLSWGLLGGLIPFSLGIMLLVFYKIMFNEK